MKSIFTVVVRLMVVMLVAALCFAWWVSSQARHYQTDLGPQLRERFGFATGSPIIRAGGRSVEVLTVYPEPEGALFRAGFRSGDIVVSTSLTGLYRALHKFDREIEFMVVDGGDGPSLSDREQRRIVVDRRSLENAPSNSMSGIYEVSTVRAASDVATAIEPDGLVGSSLIGSEISFGDGRLTMSGLACENEEAGRAAESIVNLLDPMLADINIEPAGSALSAGDARVMETYRFRCSDDSSLDVLKVDDRVILIPWEHGARYLIAQKRLTAQQVMRLQEALRSLKFYSGEATGLMDEVTWESVGFWAEYRSNSPDPYRFHRTAVTENLLDTLGVLDSR